MRLFLMVVHDWLSHLVGERPMLTDFDTSLREIISNHEGITDSRIHQWLEMTMGQDPSLTTLLYRHYLFDHVSSEEIFTNATFPPLFILMGSMLYQDVRFSPLVDHSVWDQIDGEGVIINNLRACRSQLNRQAFDFADRSDVTDYRLDRDHGLLSSHSLLYSLHLIRVILIFEYTLHGDIRLGNIIEQITTTLMQLKGVLSNGKEHWIIPHVR